MDTGTLYLLGTGLKVGATAGAGFGKLQEGKLAEKVAQYEAAGYERQAADEIAAGQRQALDTRKKTERVISKQVALGAASGSSLSSPGLLDIIGDTEQEGEYHAQAEQYAANSKAAGLKDKANIRRVEGKAARAKGSNAFIGSLLDATTIGATGIDEYRRKYRRRGEDVE